MIMDGRDNTSWWLSGHTVLAVRHSYKPGLTLVYGGAGRREDHRLAAARELREEVGITINPDTLRLVMATPNMHLYELRLTEKPELLIDRREAVEACFMHPGALREARRGGKVGEYVRRSAARPPSA
jgi:8-oxo-dGTP pyrophosphatase MutT (NUDIX family)